jgi:hypothetical protein
LFAEENGAAVAERGEVAVLVARIRLGERGGAGRKGVSGKDRGGGGGIGGGEGVLIEAEFGGEGAVENYEPGGAHRRGSDGGVEQRRKVGVGVLEAPSGGGGGGGGRSDGGGTHESMFALKGGRSRRAGGFGRRVVQRDVFGIACKQGGVGACLHAMGWRGSIKISESPASRLLP